MAATERSAGGWLARHAHSIRTRIVVGYIVLIVATFGVAIVALRQLLIARVERDTDTMMASETTALATLADTEDPNTGIPYGVDVRGLFDTFLLTRVPAGDEYFVTYLGDALHRYSLGSPIDGDAAIAASWTDLDVPLRTHFAAEGGDVEALAVPVVVDGVTRGTFVVLRTPQGALDDVDRVVRTLALVGLGVSLFGLLGAWTIAGRVLRPIDELADTARSISDRDLSARIPVTGNDELAELGHTFNAMMDRVERGVVRQRQFVDDVAHELRTPITIVSGHLELMGDDPDERAETLAVAEDELERMSRYVNDLLALARAELPEFVRFGPVDLAELLAALDARVAAIAPRAWRVDEAPPIGALVIDADHDRLVQAMVNLASNAVEHTAPGDEIGIGARRSGDRAELWVRDTGTGVDPAARDTLFDRSRRGPVSRARRPEGTGIGLSIVAAIAEAHGGDVRVDPDWTTGARFVVSVPVEHSEELPRMTRILIAEDEVRIVSFLEKGLRSSGYTTMAAHTGPDALALARDVDFELLLLDLGLPGMDGHQVLAAMRERGERMPVIVLTARDGVDDTVGALDRGADDYLTKPFRFEELLARIRVRLRDTGSGDSNLLRGDRVTLDLRTRRATVDGRTVELTSREFAIVETFLRHPGQVLSREQLLSHVWGYDFDPGSNVVDVYIRYLRRKLGDDAVETIRGMGYRM